MVVAFANIFGYAGLYVGADRWSMKFSKAKCYTFS
jgi:hypothetical protein